MIKNIRIKGFYIRTKEKGDMICGNEGYTEVENGISSCVYLLQGDTPSLLFDLTLKKGTREEKAFTDFYYFDSSMKTDKLDIRMEIETWLYGARKPENNICLDMTLLMTSNEEKEREEFLYSSNGELCPEREVKIWHFVLQDR